MSTVISLQIKLETTLSFPLGRKMYAIYSNKGISSFDRDRRQVLESRSSRQRRGLTATNTEPKNKSSSIVLLPPYSYTTTSSSSNNYTSKKKKNTDNTTNNEERQLQIAVDDLLQEHQDDIQRPKPRCTIHHRDSFSTISTRASISKKSQHHCQVKGEKRCGEFIIPTEISFSSSSSSSLHSVPSLVDSNNISLGSNHSNNSNNSKIKKSSKHLPDFPDSNVLIFDLYEDDDDDIMFIPPVVVEKEHIITSTIRSRELTMRKKRLVKRRESMGIINSAPAPPLPLRRKEMDRLSIGISRFEI